jgi:hypothetical protein
MGSLPRDKAGVGSAVNDTTREVGGALGVAVVGSVATSVYANHIDGLASSYGLSGSTLAQARGSLGGALQVGTQLNAGAATFATSVKNSFVAGMSLGLRVSGVIVVGAAFVAWRFLPARARDVGAVDDGVNATAEAVAVRPQLVPQ